MKRSLRINEFLLLLHSLLLSCLWNIKSARTRKLSWLSIKVKMTILSTNLIECRYRYRFEIWYKWHMMTINWALTLLQITETCYDRLLPSFLLNRLSLVIYLQNLFLWTALCKKVWNGGSYRDVLVEGKHFTLFAKIFHLAHFDDENNSRLVQHLWWVEKEKASVTELKHFSGLF